jgi:hypothetical protein
MAVEAISLNVTANIQAMTESKLTVYLKLLLRTAVFATPTWKVTMRLILQLHLENRALDFEIAHRASSLFQKVHMVEASYASGGIQIQLMNCTWLDADTITLHRIQQERMESISS